MLAGREGIFGEKFVAINPLFLFAFAKLHLFENIRDIFGGYLWEFFGHFFLFQKILEIFGRLFDFRRTTFVCTIKLIGSMSTNNVQLWEGSDGIICSDAIMIMLAMMVDISFPHHDYYQMSNNNGSSADIDSHISKKYEIRRRLGKVRTIIKEKVICRLI